jgi:hypothetical protein
VPSAISRTFFCLSFSLLPVLKNISLNQHKKASGGEEDGQQIIEKINRMMTAKKVCLSLVPSAGKLKSVFAPAFFLSKGERTAKSWRA